VGEAPRRNGFQIKTVAKQGAELIPSQKVGINWVCSSSWTLNVAVTSVHVSRRSVERSMIVVEASVFLIAVAVMATLAVKASKA
jgi:hypothetical protein